MKISKEYSKNLKNKIITSNMLYDSIFSLNKRAKNCRDKKNQYSWTKYYYGYFEKMNEYYNQKDFLIKDMVYGVDANISCGAKRLFSEISLFSKEFGGLSSGYSMEVRVEKIY